MILQYIDYHCFVIISYLRTYLPTLNFNYCITKCFYIVYLYFIKLSFGNHGHYVFEIRVMACGTLLCHDLQWVQFMS